MAAIAIADCTVSQWDVSGWKTVKIVTPATADDGDTIDLSSLFGTVCFGICSGATDGTVLCAATASTSVTIPGSTDNEARTILAIGS